MNCRFPSLKQGERGVYCCRFDSWKFLLKTPNPMRWMMANGEWSESIQSADSLLLYDRSAGQANVVAFDGAGKVRLQATNSNWGNSWDLIVPADFLGNQQPPEAPPAPPDDEPNPAPVVESVSGESVLVYSRTAGQADLMDFNATGKVGLNVSNSGFRKTWDMIVAGDFLKDGRSQILLYDHSAGQADVVAFDTKGGVSLDTTNSSWSKTWDMIVAGDFLGNGRSQVLLYSRAVGRQT
jgi:hypothetical protein